MQRDPLGQLNAPPSFPYQGVTAGRFRDYVPGSESGFQTALRRFQFLAGPAIRLDGIPVVGHGD